MQEIRLPEPMPEEVAAEGEPDDALRLTLTPERSKELWRLSGYFRPLFDFSGDWFSASRDRAEYVTAFRERVLAAAGVAEQRVYVVHGQGEAAFTTLGGFLERWPDLPLESPTGYDVLPLDLTFWLQVHYGGAAHVAHRAG